MLQYQYKAPGRRGNSTPGDDPQSIKKYICTRYSDTNGTVAS